MGEIIEQIFNIQTTLCNANHEPGHHWRGTIYGAVIALLFAVSSQR